MVCRHMDKHQVLEVLQHVVDDHQGIWHGVVVHEEFNVAAVGEGEKERNICFMDKKPGSVLEVAASVLAQGSALALFTDIKGKWWLRTRPASAHVCVHVDNEHMHVASHAVKSKWCYVYLHHHPEDVLDVVHQRKLIHHFLCYCGKQLVGLGLRLMLL